MGFRVKRPYVRRGRFMPKWYARAKPKSKRGHDDDVVKDTGPKRIPFASFNTTGFLRINPVASGQSWGTPVVYTQNFSRTRQELALAQILENTCTLSASHFSTNGIWVKRRFLGRFSPFISLTTCGFTSSAFNGNFNAERITEIVYEDADGNAARFRYVGGSAVTNPSTHAAIRDLYGEVFI